MRRGLICKVEEIHRTLLKHLAKEEEQLLPLLLQHFTFAEQAQLVAQFLYCIPLAAVEQVLAWLKPMVPKVRARARRCSGCHAGATRGPPCARRAVPPTPGAWCWAEKEVAPQPFLSATISVMRHVRACAHTRRWSWSS